MAINTANTLNNQEIRFEVLRGREKRTLVSDAELAECARTLRFHTENSFDSPAWRCSYQNGTKTATISFSALEIESQDLRLVKAYIVDALANGLAPTTCARYAANLKHLFDFLSQKGLHIERMSTGIANMFRIWLETEYPDAAPAKKNNIESDAARFADFAQRKGLLPPAPVAFPAPRPVKRNVLRAPEMAVMRQLDRYMFDFSHDVPTDIRCAYIIHRLLPSRSSEVRLIMLDGYQIQDDLLLLEVPTQKEAAFHRPVYKPYPFYRTGTRLEDALCLALEQQQAFALRMQPNIQTNQQGYLMVSTAHPYRLLNTQEFNTALRQICEQLRLTDSQGAPVRITSHLLRHVSIGNQLRFGVPSEEVQHRSNHKTADMTLAYGYPSKTDETAFMERITAAIQAKMTDEDRGPTNSNPYYELLPRRFAKMRREDVWLLGDDCLCQQCDCKPQWEHCIMECEHFQPDPHYLPMAYRICDELEQAGEKMTKLQRRQLAIWKKFIERTGVK